MKGEIQEFLRLVWHFLNLEINAGTHIEARERKRMGLYTRLLTLWDLCLICFSLDFIPAWPCLDSISDGSCLWLLQAWDSCVVLTSQADLLDSWGIHLPPWDLPTLISASQDQNPSSASGSQWGLVLASHNGGSIRQVPLSIHWPHHLSLAVSEAT